MRGAVPTLPNTPAWRGAQSFTFTFSGLDDRGSRVRFPEEAWNFSLHDRIQNGSGTHPVSNLRGTRCSFPGSKAAGA
jgi:hypothetical protein